MFNNSLKRKMLSFVVATALCAGIFASAEIALAKTTGHTVHKILSAPSREGNPLKGLFPFEDGTDTDFPHSMEWFYISVKEVQTGMNSFDWTALEKHLDAIAGRGHQAVFRFYYDYPGMPTGVPEFLIDGGLKMNQYDEPDNLGGSGYSPDYENQTFRTSMQNFIKAFGAEYDGDPRIGYLTLGLLGFWGEWHTWPYDGWNPPKENWTPSNTVYTEVLTAFDKAFNKTPLCVREPKDGIPNAEADIGYHDDSFSRATLTADAGGQSWSFMEKVTAAKEQNKWKTNPIGGEVYPVDQMTLFASDPWMGGEGQTWEACLAQAHPTWLMCHKIQVYTGDTLQNARIASRQLGYDFQVAKAYYDNVTSSEPLYLGIDIKNIGIAPFYYDHTMWPIQVGVKKSGKLVKSWTTSWDLDTIPADKSVKTFEYSVKKHGLAEGSYTICIKVINPLKNGDILGFANKGQNKDGWLDLGKFKVTKAN